VYVPAPPGSSLAVTAGQRVKAEDGPVNVHAKPCLIPEPLRTLRPETKGQAGACPDRTRAIPCNVRAGHGAAPMTRNIRGVITATRGMSDQVHAGLRAMIFTCASSRGVRMR
jgi:hypothetical protein